MMMIENLDMAIVINREKSNQQDYMVFSSVKMRDNLELAYFAQPLVSKIKLVEDVGLPAPVYRTTLVSQGSLFDSLTNNGTRTVPGGAVVVDSVYDDFGDEGNVYTINTPQDIGVPDIKVHLYNLLFN